jgi:hypothetical protein
MSAGDELFSSNVGEFAEGMPWRFVANVEHTASDVSPCPHCINVRPSPPQRRADGSIWNAGYLSWTIPLAIEASNEAGHNQTLVCAQCVSDALSKLADER